MRRQVFILFHASAVALLTNSNFQSVTLCSAHSGLLGCWILAA
jgi:hypothetical protein